MTGSLDVEETTYNYLPPNNLQRFEQSQMMDDESSLVFCYKVVILGDSGSGKTALLTRFTEDFFSERFAPTIGVDFKTKQVIINGTPMKLQFWDTAGQERFRAIVTSYHRSVNGVLLIYDITNRRSFHNLSNWKKVVDEYNPRKDFAVALVGNKCELNDHREVTEKEGRDLADDFGALFYEVSAKKNINVTEAFMAVAQAIKQQQQSLLGVRLSNDNKQPINVTTEKNGIVKKKKPCCS